MVKQKISSQDRNGYWASWNNHSKLDDPNFRGIILEPEQDTVAPSAVRSLTPEAVVVGGAGNTDMDAPESTRKRRLERESWR